LAAATAAEVLGITPPEIAAGLGAVAGVPGRFEAIDAGQPFSVIVDYAHTPDGLERVLGSVAGSVVPPGRITVVFGAGGDRDRSKRPLMAAVATGLADRVVLTSDNPRGEDPLAIIAGIAAGAVRPEIITIEPDRSAAITLALSEARPGDVVLIAGKGHEAGQVIGEIVVPFDDRDVARQALHALGWASPDRTS
jgi:UDP-N-acetylmuramoyl-L-alanyl-D-glutamate--2,6-diaminopimelate ligase